MPYLALVRPRLGYATQVWSPQSIELIRKVEQIQRRATKFVLGLPFRCNQSYSNRLIHLKLLPICYWHELLDLVFFKIVTGAVRVNPSITPQVLITRTTRSNSSPDVTHYVPRKCKTSTFQRSFLDRTIRTWNCLAKHLKLSPNLTMNQFKSVLYKYYLESLSSHSTQTSPALGRQSVHPVTLPANWHHTLLVVFNLM